MKQRPKRVLVRFYKRNEKDPDVRISLDARGTKFEGAVRLLIPNEDFSKLKPNGNLKHWNLKDVPKLSNGILISDMLIHLRNFIEDAVTDRIPLIGCNLSKEDVRGIFNDARNDLFNTLKRWVSNKQWNSLLLEAYNKGKLNKFMKQVRPLMWTDEPINWGEVVAL